MRFRFTRGQRTPLLADLALVISSTVLGPRSGPHHLAELFVWGAADRGPVAQEGDWERGF